MLRRVILAVLTAALASTALVAGSAAAVQPSASRITAATTTPWTDAGTGVATFVVSGLPSGTAALQWFDPSRGAWTNAAKVARKGSRGTATATGLPAGVNRFRVKAGARSSNAVYVRTYGVYTFDQFTKQHAFGTAVLPARDYYLQDVTLKVPDGHGCERIDLGLEIIQQDAPNWTAEISAQSAVLPAPVIAITSSNVVVPMAVVTGAAVSGPIDVVFRASASNRQPFFAWAGVQVHCLTDPGI